MTEVHQMNAEMALTGKTGGFVVEDDPTPSSLSDQEAGPVQASSGEEDNKTTRLCVSPFASLQNRDASRGPLIEPVASDRETSGAMDEFRSSDLEQKFEENNKFGMSNGVGMADKTEKTVDRLEEPETPMTNGAARCVLVAKCLTNSDASSGRIILPRVAVEANLPFVTAYRHYSLTVSDTRGRRYEFIIKSWANGTEHRRVFVLEQAAEFLRNHGVSVGDVIGICSDAAGGLVVEANTDAVKEAIVSPRYGAGPFQMSGPTGTGKSAGLRDAQGSVPLVQSYSGRCIRSIHCTKPAGHPGFCSGPKAAAAAAAAAAQAHAAGAAAAARYRARRGSRRGPLARASAMMYGAGHDDGNDLHHQHQDPSNTNHQVEGASECSSDELLMCRQEPEKPAKPFTPQSAGIPLDLLPPHAREFELAYIPSGGTVTKALTPYDLSSRRVILSAQEVEEAMPCAQKQEACIVAAVDECQCWHFLTLRAWHSVAGRRGYLLEGAENFLAARGAGPGDYLVVYRSRNHSPPRVELRQGGDGVKVMHPKLPGKATTSNPKFANLPLLLHPQGVSLVSDPQEDEYDYDYDEGHHMEELRSIRVRKAASMRSSMVCRRTNGCTKAAGHQGFCSGHKGFRKRHGDASDLVHGYTSAMVYASGGGGSRRGKIGYEIVNHPSDEDEYTPSFAKRARGGGGGREPEYDPLLSLLEAASS